MKVHLSNYEMGTSFMEKWGVPSIREDSLRNAISWCICFKMWLDCNRHGAKHLLLCPTKTYCLHWSTQNTELMDMISYCVAHFAICLVMSRAHLSSDAPTIATFSQGRAGLGKVPSCNRLRLAFFSKCRHPKAHQSPPSCKAGLELLSTWRPSEECLQFPMLSCSLSC